MDDVTESSGIRIKHKLERGSRTQDQTIPGRWLQPQEEHYLRVPRLLFSLSHCSGTVGVYLLSVLTPKIVPVSLLYRLIEASAMANCKMP